MTCFYIYHIQRSTSVLVGVCTYLNQSPSRYRALGARRHSAALDPAWSSSVTWCCQQNSLWSARGRDKLTGPSLTSATSIMA